jgi:GNAT superfamily N-acetyltransferase
MSTQVRELTASDLDDVLRIQELVTRDLPPGFLWPRSEQELRAYLDGTVGVAYGVAEDGALVGWGLLRLPSAGASYAGPPFPLVPSEDQPLRLAFLGNGMVHPDHRRRGHQRALYAARRQHAARAGMRWLAAGTHVANVASWGNLLDLGMRIAGVRLDTGYPLIGLLEGLGEHRLATDADVATLVPLADPAQHQSALDAGFVGVRRHAHGVVRYERLIARDYSSATPKCAMYGARLSRRPAAVKPQSSGA